MRRLCGLRRDDDGGVMVASRFSKGWENVRGP